MGVVLALSDIGKFLAGCRVDYSDVPKRFDNPRPYSFSEPELCAGSPDSGPLESVDGGAGTRYMSIRLHYTTPAV